MNLPIYLLEINEDLMDGSEVDFVALVDKPAIERNFLRFKEDRMNFEIQDEERRIISGPIMLADTPIYRNDNGQEYFVSFPKDTIYKIVKKMFQKGYTSNVNLMHDPNQVVDGVTMFEIWITDESRGIKPMKGFEDAPDGSAFASYSIDNQDVWNDVKSGKFKGFSVEGMFNYKKEPKTMSTEEKLWSDIAKILDEIEFGGPGSGRRPEGGADKESKGTGRMPKVAIVKPGDPRVSSLMEGAKASAGEVDKVGKGYAEKLGGVVTPINLKSEDSILRKVNDEEGGKVSAIKDAVRNTVVIDRDKIGSARDLAKSDPRFSAENGGRIKVQEGDQFFGYSGTIVNFKTENGTMAEMQINTPAMIYAKEKEGSARAVLGDKKYDEIAKRTGLPGGQGHALYEEIRVLNAGRPTVENVKRIEELKSQSINYYKNFGF
jgi:Putative phage serine protease XkdF